MGVRCVRGTCGGERASGPLCASKRNGGFGLVIGQRFNVSAPLRDLRGEDEVGVQGLGPQGLPVDGAAAGVAQPPCDAQGVKGVAVAVRHRLPHDRKGNGANEVLRGLQPQRGCNSFDLRIFGSSRWVHRSRRLAGQKDFITIARCERANGSSLDHGAHRDGSVRSNGKLLGRHGASNPASWRR